MKTLLPILLLAVFVIFTTHAEADTVFDEDFSGGEGAFSGFDTGNCNWHTPGANATFTTYFGNGEFAEITKSGCLLTSFTRALVSDEFDLSGYENAELSFNHYFTQSGAISQGQVSVSTDGGSNWTPVYTTSGGNTGTVETADLSAYDGESTVSLRFEFNYFGGILASAWGFDDVTVEADVVADDDTGDDDTGDDDTGDDDTGDDDTGDDDTGDDDTGDDDATDIAYIYSGNITRATDFETFLLGEGYDVHVYQIAELDTDLDLSDIEVFVIDPDTSADWTMTRREAVTDTGMPVITDGDGFQVLSGSGTYIAGGHFIAEQEKNRPRGVQPRPSRLAHSQ
ncbi:MAG: immune inhibitor A [Deltaproteobacteria bacterium]|nr:immune inhibitor A [Deltaproteobacteria bacterium]